MNGGLNFGFKDVGGASRGKERQVRGIASKVQTAHGISVRAGWIH